MYSTGLFLLHHRVLSPLKVTRWYALCAKGFKRKYLFASQEKDIYLFYTFYITRIRTQGAPDGTITRKDIYLFLLFLHHEAGAAIL